MVNRALQIVMEKFEVWEQQAKEIDVWLERDDLSVEKRALLGEIKADREQWVELTLQFAREELSENEYNFQISVLTSRNRRRNGGLQ